MDTPVARFKLEEAQFFFDRMTDRDDRGVRREPRAFKFI